MATFDDILHDAQPALQFGRQAIEEDATEGRDWFWTFSLYDTDDEPIDLDALGVTGECVVYTPADRGTGAGTAVLTLDVSIDGAEITVTAEDGDTAGTADGKSIRRCPWRFTLTETATGRSCDVWGVRDSTLAIRGDD